MEENEIVKQNQEVLDTSIFKDLPTGFEGLDINSFTLPLIRIIEPMSQVLKEDSPEYNPNARPGYFLLPDGTLTKELSGFILKSQRRVLAWKVEQADGKIKRKGFAGNYSPVEAEGMEDKAKTEGFLRFDKKGNILIDTMEFFIYLKKDGDPVAGIDSIHSNIGILSLSVSRYKDARRLNSRLTSKLVIGNEPPRNYPAWALLWKISIAKTGKDTDTWHTIGKTEPLRIIYPAELAEEIKPALQLIETADVSYEKEETEISSPQADGKDMPF